LPAGCFGAIGTIQEAHSIKRMITPMPAKKPTPVAIIRPRIAFGSKFAVGPGKIDLLRAIAASGSISGAARSLGMTYKRAWLLIDSMNQGFGRPVVERSIGGKGGGGAWLTSRGEALLRHYDDIERVCQEAAASSLALLDALKRRKD
jgi:molybdate transport system regulatory protein